MTTDNPATPPEPSRWPYTEPVEPAQTALPIPEPTPDEAILYPSDPTQYPSPGEPISPVARPGSVSDMAPPALGQAPVHEPPTGPWFLDDEPLPEPAPETARAGIGRGVLLGLLLGAVIAATAFGLGRVTAGDDDPIAALAAKTATTVVT
ncbi:MAG: hypothetical protein GY778_03530, partial [bacterium]|nr:hypothetical protein [bacterium]